MRLQRLQIKNFRALEHIDVEFNEAVSVIIGPNATGKTTILEGIRLAKSLLAPRTQGEAANIMNSLGAMSPHIPQRLFHANLTKDPSMPLIIKSSYLLSEAEVATIESISSQVATRLALQGIGQAASNPAQVAAFLTSLAGKNAQSEASTNVANEMGRIISSRRLDLNLTIDFTSGNISGEFPTHNVMFQSLEGQLSPSKTIFSYFPADRAMLTGEVPVQLGIADSINQLEAHNSQPQLKYGRLKSLIFNTIITGDHGRTELKDQFKSIFEKILKGRSLGEIGINPLGMLSIPIIDDESGVAFDIDGLSSGEKGVILTFLVMFQSIVDDGIILLDEPELHLNPAVCRDTLQFLIDEFTTKHNIQVILCSHSPEILAGAFDKENCALLHLRSGKSLAKVRHQDRGELRDALRRLGSSESEALLYKGTVSVEGIHDVEILELGFSEIFRRFRLKQRGGRSQVEADIRELQIAEKKGDEIGNHYFVFDLDAKPTNLIDSISVRLLQLGKYCLENFLIDIDILTDLSREKDFSATAQPNTSDMFTHVKRIAMSQLCEVVARAVFKEMNLEKIAFNMSGLGLSSASAVGSNLNEQIADIKQVISAFENPPSMSGFEELFAARHASLSVTWDGQWRDICNGKRLFEDLRKEGLFKGDLLKLKKRIIVEMRSCQTNVWKSLASELKTLVS